MGFILGFFAVIGIACVFSAIVLLILIPIGKYDED